MNNDTLIEKIIALVDGELDAEESAEILDYINQNPALQEEFNYHLKMKNVYNRMTEQPPSHLKSKILASSGLGFLFWKTKSFIISSISTGVVIATIVGYYLGINDIDNSSDSTNYVKTESFIKLPELPNIYANEVEDFNNSNNYSNQLLKEKIILEYINSIKSQINQEEIIISNSNNDEILEISNKLESENSYNLDDFTLTNSSIVNQLSSNFNFNLNKKYKVRKIYSSDEEYKSFFQMLNIDVRKSLSNNRLNLNFDNPETNQFNISSISLYYEYNDFIDVGIEAGSENFAQKYKFVENDKTTNYQQYFNAYYLGISAKYYLPLEFFDILKLYSKGFIGGNNLGPVTRVELAVELNLNNEWYLYSGFEISNLSYYFGGSTFHSSKSGFNLGLKYDIK